MFASVEQGFEQKGLILCQLNELKGSWNNVSQSQLWGLHNKVGILLVLRSYKVTDLASELISEEFTCSQEILLLLLL